MNEAFLIQILVMAIAVYIVVWLVKQTVIPEPIKTVIYLIIAILVLAWIF